MFCVEHLIYIYGLSPASTPVRLLPIIHLPTDIKTLNRSKNTEKNGINKKRGEYPECTWKKMESSSDGEDVEGNDDEMPTLCYRQRLEKSTGGEVVLMEWSPTMDLLAVAFADHSVS